jgi:hypothetical protein
MPDTLSKLEFVILEHGHSISVVINHIMDGSQDMPWFPQPSRVLPWRARRFRPDSSSLIRFRRRLAQALKSLITRSGGTSASTTLCTWLLRTWTANRIQLRLADTSRIASITASRRIGPAYREPDSCIPARPPRVPDPLRAQESPERCARDRPSPIHRHAGGFRRREK